MYYKHYSIFVYLIYTNWTLMPRFFTKTPFGLVRLLWTNQKLGRYINCRITQLTIMNRKITYILTPLILFLSSLLNSAWAEEGLRIEIKKDGIYYINYQAMVEAGIPTDTDPKTIKIFNQGVEIPIYVYGENDSSTLNPSVYYIEFYAKGIHRDSEYYNFTNSNIYWLEWGGEKGKRVTPKDGKYGNMTPPPSFLTSLRVEKDQEWWWEKPDTEEDDQWYWEKIRGGEAREYSFILKNIAKIGRAHV